jgi:hypothetical protein
MSVHRDMDELSQAASNGETFPRLLEKLTAITSKCVACHATWQLRAEQ